MSSQPMKGKVVARSSELECKRSRSVDRVPQAPSISHGQFRTYGKKGVVEAGKKWYLLHKESKYSVDQFIDRLCLLKGFPSMVHTHYI